MSDLNNVTFQQLVDILEGGGDQDSFGFLQTFTEKQRIVAELKVTALELDDWQKKMEGLQNRERELRQQYAQLQERYKKLEKQ